jgi:transglutaminase-like putative cysteine protease
MGNGSYTVSIIDQAANSSFYIVKQERLVLDIADEKLVFMNSIQNVNYEYAQSVLKQGSALAKKGNTQDEKLKAAYSFMVRTFSYDFDKYNNLSKLKNYIPSPEATLTLKKGICYDYSSLFASILRNSGFKVKLVKGYAPRVNGYHAWNEVYVGSKWHVIDTTYDSQMDHANQKYDMYKDNDGYKKTKEY